MGKKDGHNTSDVPLNGKLITYDDPATIGNNYQQLTNLRYADSHPVGVRGMTKINTTALTNVKIRNGFHFRKENPSESHVLAQSFDGSDANPIIYDNETAIPSAGDFNGTSVMTDDTDASTGYFADAPNGNMVYCNKSGTYIWAGDEQPAVSLITSTAAVADTITNPKDYSDEIRNDRTGTADRAILGGGDDNQCKLLLHLNAADTTQITPFIDDASGSAQTVTAQGNCQADTDFRVFGQSGALFDGDSDYLEVNDDGDFNFSNTEFTLEGRVRFKSSGLSDVIDSSGQDHAVTKNGTAVLSETNYKWGTDSLWLDGDSDYLSLSDHADWDIVDVLAEDWTVDFWVKHDDHAGTECYICHLQDANNFWAITHTHGSGIRFFVKVAAATIINTGYGTEITDTNWHHIALVKVGGGAAAEWACYLDGNQINYTSDGNHPAFAGSLFIGRASTAYYDGNIDEVRINKNNVFSASPQSDNSDTITIPTSAHTADANTKLLLHMDVSTSNEGMVAIWSQSDNANNDIVALWQDFSESKLHWYVMSAGTLVMHETATWAPSIKTWYHLAVIRGWGGTTDDWAITVDGSTITTFTDSGTCPDVGANVFIGNHPTTVVIDESESGHDVSTVGNAVLSSTQQKWGTGSVYFDGTGDYLQISDHADFDLVADTTNYTIDFWVKHDDHAGTETYICQQEDANNYWRLHHIDGSGIQFEVFSGGGAIIDTGTAGEITDTDWHHIALIKTSTTYSIYVDGTRTDTETDASTDSFAGDVYVGGFAAANYYAGYIDELRVYQGNPFGAASEATITVPTAAYDEDADTDCKLLIHGNTLDFNGWMDEIRLSNVARWTTDGFSTPAIPYSPTSLFWVIGSTKALKGVKYYVQTGNEQTATITCKEWNGSSWESLTVTDNTSGMTTTGWINFTDTINTSKIKYLNNQLLYWYLFAMTTGTAEVYKVTTAATMQPLKDIWDGIERECLSFQVYEDSTYRNNTVNVYKDEYSSTNSATYTVLDSLATGTEYIVCGFQERQMGLIFNLIPQKENSTAATTMTVYFWDGNDWRTVGNITDGTSEGAISFGKSGVVSWNPVNEEEEFKREINNEAFLYYYKVAFDKNLDAEVELYYCAGIPAQKTIKSFAYPVFASNRVWLLSEQDGVKNKIMASAPGTAEVFNGSEALEFNIGDESEIIAGAPIYMQLSSNLYDAFVACKKSSTWLIVPSTDGISTFPISNDIGCVAPGTMKTMTTMGAGENKSVVIWQGANGMYMFDAKTPVRISDDVMDIFDKAESTSINTSLIDRSMGGFDYENNCYHWLYAAGSSTSLDTEVVYDIKRNRWYNIDRGTGKDLTCIIEVFDTNGVTYSYGCINTGYMERLEYGTSFDSNDIVHTLHTGDMVMSGEVIKESRLRGINLVTLSTNTTTNTISGTHYVDGSTTAESTFTLTPQQSGKRIARTKSKEFAGQSSGIFHSIKLQMTTDDETIGFEPMFMSLRWKFVREDY